LSKNVGPRDGTFLTDGSDLEFSDGMKFKTGGELHIESRSDGLYVVGKGMLIPVNSREEGDEIIKEMK
jgi:hypothetical protein